MGVLKKIGRPKGSKNKKKVEIHRSHISVLLRETALQGIIDIHMETGVGLPQLLQAAIMYATERPYRNNKRFREIITEVINMDDVE